MERLRATYRITTPMFLTRDARTAELRPTSFRGALRFWYRAIALPRLGDWRAVKQAEERIFGSAGTGQGQGGFLVHLEPHALVTGRAWELWQGRAGSAYLGYGCIGWRRETRQIETQRAYIQPGQEFTATLTLRPGPDRRCQLCEEDLADLQRALIALGLFGGLGGRSRRGFGSISLTHLQLGGEEVWAAPRDLQSLGQAIESLVADLGSLPEGLPVYTAFSHLARVVVVQPPAPFKPGSIPAAADPLKLLDEVGAELIRYRSNGRTSNGRRTTAIGTTPETTFAPDHDPG